MEETRREKLEIERELRAPRAEVFEAFTDPSALMGWWAPEHWETPRVEVDLREGGRYRFGMREKGGADMLLHVRGSYREIVRPSRLVFTYIWEGDGLGEIMWGPMGLIELETLVTLDLEERAGGVRTLLRLTHEGFPDPASRAAHVEGWSSNLDECERYLER